MLQPAYVRENQSEIAERLNKRNLPGAQIVEQIISLDNARKEAQIAFDNKQSEYIKTSTPSFLSLVFYCTV